MIPFSDYLVLQEVKRTNSRLWEQMTQSAEPDQMPQPPEQPEEGPEEEPEEPEETDPSEEDEEGIDDKKTDLKMIHNCIKQVKTPELKNILRQFLDKLKHTSPSEPASQMDEPPATQVPEEQPPEQPPEQNQPGAIPAQGGNSSFQ
jgi:hypothetical protein